TVLRCVGWLSRDDFATRRGHAGPPSLETPAAQMPGVWEFDYAVIVGGDDLSAYRQAYAFEAPMRAVRTGLQRGRLPAQASFLTSEPDAFIISAVKQAEDGRGWLVRGYNLTAQDLRVTLRPRRRFRSVERANLAEDRIGSLKADRRGSVTVPVRRHEIVTLLFRE
ncbi:MAG: hypothetical protein FJZ97_02650, partial [Chloroflexi bacterium]|nr:hypothetical protein [Chloroflexota bacterium]